MPSSGTVYFKRGEIVSEEEAAKQDAVVWAEVRPSKFSHIWKSSQQSRDENIPFK
jgi:hypothetical protein